MSASKKMHFEYWVKFQHCSLVKVIPSSGLSNRAKLILSFESSAFTSTTSSNMVDNWYFIGSLTPSGVIIITVLRVVPERFKDFARTKAPYKIKFGSLQKYTISAICAYFEIDTHQSVRVVGCQSNPCFRSFSIYG